MTPSYVLRPIGYGVICLLASISGLARAQTATLILLNGRVWTENPHLPESEAIAIHGPRILAVGRSADIRKLAGPNCRIIDLQGRRVAPGFNDFPCAFPRRRQPPDQRSTD